MMRLVIIGGCKIAAVAMALEQRRLNAGSDPPFFD